MVTALSPASPVMVTALSPASPVMVTALSPASPVMVTALSGPVGELQACLFRLCSLRCGPLADRWPVEAADVDPVFGGCPATARAERPDDVPVSVAAQCGAYRPLSDVALGRDCFRRQVPEDPRRVRSGSTRPRATDQTCAADTV